MVHNISMFSRGVAAEMSNALHLEVKRRFIPSEGAEEEVIGTGVDFQQSLGLLLAFRPAWGRIESLHSNIG